MDEKYLRATFAELIGTFVFVFLSAGAVCVAPFAASQTGPLLIALSAGFAYAGALAATLHVSGGYLNPAITIALWVFKRLPGVKTLVLIFVQLLGSALAGLALRLVLPYQESVFNVTRLGAPHLHLEVFNAPRVTMGPLLQGIAIELVLTFVLVFAIFGLMFDPRAPRWFGTWGGRLIALWLGLLLIAGTIVGGPLTGAAANPARWFGPVLAEATVPSLSLGDTSAWADNAVYWIGPVAGALIAGWLYTALILPPEEELNRGSQPTSIAATPVSSPLFRVRR
jgi:MIP family channel proteins